jgi:hypothetical protein
MMAINSSSLTKISFPKLSWIDLVLFLIGVPLVEQLEVANDVVVGEFDLPFTTDSSIIDDTGPSKADGILSGTPRNISIPNNPKLQTINLPSTQIYLQRVIPVT